MQNEFELINSLTSRFKQKDSKVITTIGDDAACVKIGKKNVLISNDGQIENVHFLRSFPPHGVGYKLIASNVSDILACGGKAKWVNLSIALPQDIKQQWLEELYNGVNQACKDFNICVIGGNTTKSATLAIEAFIVGTTKRIILRSGAKEGDLLYVSAPLGSSRFGLEQLLKGDLAHPLSKSHLYPLLPIKLSKIVRKYASSCIDISDGLAGDIGQIMNSSHIGFAINNLDIMIDDRLLNYMDRQSAIKYAVDSGEEYQLLFTVPRKYAKKIQLVPIGFATKKQELAIDGKIIDAIGYRHC
jgi:thiamine-monophosphate kinase